MSLNDTLDQMCLTHIFRIFQPKAAEHTFFSSAQGTFSRIDHILGHKSARSTYKKVEIIPCIFSDHSTTKLEINHKEQFWKGTNRWKMKNILIKNEWADQRFKEEIETYMEVNENDRHHNSKPLGCSKVSQKRKLCSKPGFPKDKRKVSETQQPLDILHS